MMKKGRIGTPMTLVRIPRATQRKERSKARKRRQDRYGKYDAIALRVQEQAAKAAEYRPQLRKRLQPACERDDRTGELSGEGAKAADSNAGRLAVERAGRPAT